MNPFEDKTAPELLALVQGMAGCEECGDDGRVQIEWGGVHYGGGRCPTCSGTGKHPPLTDAELDAVLSEAFKRLTPQQRNKILEMLENPADAN